MGEPERDLRPTLVAVIGPVETGLLREFVSHYRRLGVERFSVACHFPPWADGAQRENLLGECHELIGPPAIVAGGEYSANRKLTAELRRRAGPGWHLLADADEFQCYPQSIPTTIRRAVAAGARVVTGLMIDRVAADGRLVSWSLDGGLDRAYPLGGFVTARLSRGCPHKVVLAHSTAELSVGNHGSPDPPEPEAPLVAVHHFKWRDGLVPYLRGRLSRLSSGAEHDTTGVVAAEIRRILTHIQVHDCRIDVGDPRLGFRPVTLTRPPHAWSVESRAVLEEWGRWHALRIAEESAAAQGDRPG